MNFWHRLTVPLLAAAITAAVFLPSVRYGLTFWDDDLYVTNNTHVLEGLSVENAVWAFQSKGYASNWHPLTWLSLMADVSLASRGGHTRTMHLHNILLHSANAALLLVLMSLLCRGGVDRLWLLALALLWSLHPLRTEVVCWVSERKELLCVFWMLLGLIFHVRERNGATVICAVLALLAKPVAVGLPVILLAYDGLFRGRIRWVLLAVVVLAAAFAGWMTMGAQTQALEVGADQAVSIRSAAIFGAPIVYLAQMFWPVGLSAVYARHMEIAWPLVIGGVALVAGMVAICGWWLVGRRRPLLDLGVFAIAWSYVGLIPMLGIVQVGPQEHADRYTYWIGCGIVACLALLVSRGHGVFDAAVKWASRVDGRTYDRSAIRRILLRVAFLPLLILIPLTMRSMPRWHDSLALLRDTAGRCWAPEIVQLLVMELEKDGPGHHQEEEHYLRLCAKNHPNARAFINLACFLFDAYLRDPAATFGGGVLAEPELLVRQALALEPGHHGAKELLDKIRRAQEAAR